ncbi:MAG: hypothetical protein H7Y00_13555 [Fimbriimonadaceae bacterium]|nr:hypothetical protein [Chitinophagales bacterium]
MNRFYFWQQWLFWSCILFALFGVAFAFCGNTVLFNYFNGAYEAVFWKNETIPSQFYQYKNFVYGSFGGTIVCCYILLAYIIRYPFRKKEKWSYYSIITAFSVWVFIDSFTCVVHKVYFQIYVINAFSIIVKALPLIFTWKYFFRKEK